MSWRDIIKAPVPISTTVERDTGRTERITQWEEETLSPKLIQYIKNLPPNTPAAILFKFGNTGQDSFTIGTTAGGFPMVTLNDMIVQNVGGDKSFFLDTLKNIYIKEGYKITPAGVDELFVEKPMQRKLTDQR